MKNIKKYLGILVVMLMVPLFAQAEITVKQTVSPEFIYNQGYSDEVSRVIKVKTVEPSTPIPAPEKNTKLKNFGWYLLETIDPTVDRPGKFVNHNIKNHSSIDDL